MYHVSNATNLKIAQSWPEISGHATHVNVKDATRYENKIIHAYSRNKALSRGSSSMARGPASDPLVGPLAHIGDEKKPPGAMTHSAGRSGTLQNLFSRIIEG